MPRTTRGRSPGGAFFRSPGGVFGPGLPYDFSIMIQLIHDESVGGVPTVIYDNSNDGYTVATNGSGTFFLWDGGVPKQWSFVQSGDVGFLVFLGVKYRVNSVTGSGFNLNIHTTGITPPVYLIEPGTDSYSYSFFGGSYDGNGTGYYDYADVYQDDLTSFWASAIDPRMNIDITIMNYPTKAIPSSFPAADYDAGFPFWHDGTGFPSQIDATADYDPLPGGSAMTAYIDWVTNYYNPAKVRLDVPDNQIVYYQLLSTSASSWVWSSGSGGVLNHWMNTPSTLSAFMKNHADGDGFHSTFGWTYIPPAITGLDFRYEWDMDYIAANPSVSFQDSIGIRFTDERWLMALKRSIDHFKTNFT